ncbi:T6SS immunity protein Tli4 family protein [Limnobaculum parvum]|uniref:Tle cognate immunity protein 4 C-terminal domain-containing protein n=1 Tax=Limnobaculum parvum TaxID=2172103 RepID=A0A2Y9TU79_9GAMM|nr:T6SS immunity protein Tli4 family protein [Limnobaculum parvum]AWH87257.1 hypothetical protein HYN51_00995 [Limnobaculum parvum]
MIKVDRIFAMIGLYFFCIASVFADIGYTQDCIGNYQYQVPSDSRQALIPMNIESVGKIPINENLAKFPNGDNTFPNYQNKNNLNGVRFYFFKATNNEKLNQYLKAVIQNFEKVKKNKLESRLNFERADALYLRYKKINQRDYFFNLKSYKTYLFSDKLAYYSYKPFKDDTPADVIEQQAVSVNELVTYRPSENIPNAQGVCFPNAFLHGKITVGGQYSIAYQLLSHPEVTFTIQEEVSFGDIDNDKDSKERIISYWKYAPGFGEKTRYLGFPVFRSFKIGGIKGAEAMVEYINPKNQQPDYGYMINAEANKPGESSLFFMALRDSSKATGEVMSKDDFEATMRQIAKSIQRREIAP